MSGNLNFWGTVKWLAENEYAYSMIYKEEREELKLVRERNSKRTFIDTGDFKFVMDLKEAVNKRLAKGQKALLRGAGFNV